MGKNQPELKPSVNIVDGLSKDTMLWKYMSLDKLIYLLDKQCLFFSPLEFYKKTDPYEGYLPKIALENLLDSKRIRKELLEARIEKLKSIVGSAKGELTPDIEKSIARLERDEREYEEICSMPKRFWALLAKRILVNCWHSNQFESEAMWNLYSDLGKGVVIKTSVESLISSISDTSLEREINIGKVKYLNYLDPNLTNKDCSVGGHSAPLIKRLSFSHENEVRLFLFPDIKMHELEQSHQVHRDVRVELSLLIEEIIVSPYADPTFVYAVSAVCKKYGLDCSISQSALLSGYEELMDSIFSDDE